MLDRFWETINNKFAEIRSFLDKNKKFFFYLILVVIIVYATLRSFGVTILILDNFFRISPTDSTNFFNLISEGDFFYVVWVVSLIKMHFLNFIFSAPIFFFHDIFENHIFSFFLNLSYKFKFYGYGSLTMFYESSFNGVKSSYDSFKYEYFRNRRFLKLIFLNSNLPVFFYFGMLFIFSTILSLFLLSYLGLYGVFIINLITILMFWFSSIFYFNSFYIDNVSYKINLGKWFIIAINHIVYFDIFIDSVSYSFMFLTLTIAVFVYIYAFSYFRYEPNVERLILLINCFVISMICLVTSGNFFVLFLGWELIGLTSFFLINFWSTRISTLKAAFKAFVFNKFSDVSLLIGIFIIFFCINDINIVSFNSQISNYNNFYINILDWEFSIVEVISFFLITCSFVKSAQFGFHIWLPDSM